MTARFMTWNIKGSANPDLDRIAEVIRRYDPDVLALQEVKASQARQIAKRLGWHHRWARKHFPYGPFLWWRAEGLAVLSRHLVDHKHRYLLSPGVRSWTYKRRIALRVKVWLPDLMIRVFDVHLASHAAARERAAQAQLLAGRIAEERMLAEEEPETYRAVVLGDLNAHDERTTLEPLEVAGFTDCWTVAEAPPTGTGYTVAVHDPRGRIDYVLIERDDACERVEVPEPDEAWRRLSDHWPVVATVRFG